MALGLTTGRIDGGLNGYRWIASEIKGLDGLMAGYIYRCMDG